MELPDRVQGEGEAMNETLTEVYEKYKHLDHLLSDRTWLDDKPMSGILHGLWMAVRKAVGP